MSIKDYEGGIITKNPTTPTGPYQDGVASGVWTMDQAAEYTKQGVWPTAGNVPPYVDDVFSTYLYTGTGSTQTITNGIDLSGEGGWVWTKQRSLAGDHWTFNTESGVPYATVRPNLTNSQFSGDTTLLTSFNSDGFTLGADTSNRQLNTSGTTMVSWTFRKQAGFFDVVTYTGNSTSGRGIAHNLGSTPGFVIVKCTSDAEVWRCFHRTFSAGDDVSLNSTGAVAANGHFPTVPDSDNFYVGAGNQVNGTSKTYVAYVFAHDDQSFGDNADESIIKCGSYTGNGTVANATTEQPGPEIDLGWEPQWVMIKRTDSTSDWFIFDNMRGFSVDYTGQDKNYLRANGSNAESALSSSFAYLRLTSTGFKITAGTGSFFNENGGEYIYVAIRRPMKPITTNTELFNPIAVTTTTPTQTYSVGFPADLFLQGFRTLGISARTNSRITGSEPYLQTASNAAEQSGFGGEWDLQDDYAQSSGVSTTAISYFFRRAPGFMDAVGYRGNATAGTTYSHSLTVAPELMIVKRRDGNGGWQVYSSALGATKYLVLDENYAEGTSSNQWNDTAPTASVFTLGNIDTNESGVYYVAYLFATLAGVSKVGSYTGTGSPITVDCGFTSGARFILIKRTDSTGDWYYFDTARGINAGADPYLSLNTTDVESSTDAIDTDSSGFIVNAAGGGLNTSGGEYIFLAIA